MSEGTEEVSYSMVFKNYEFVKLLLGQIFSNSGDAIIQTAIILYVYSFTGSLTITTTVLAVQMIPWIVIGPIAGVLADKISRKAIMLFADLLRAVAIAFLPIQSSIIGIGVIVFFLGVASSSFAAPRSAVIPEIVGLELFVKAISISQLIFQTIRIIGPLVTVYVYILLGVNAFYFSSLFYIISFIFIFLTLIPKPGQIDELSIKSVYRDLLSGFNYLIHERIISKILILFTIIILGSSFAGTLIYPFIYEILHNGNLEAQSQSEFGIIGAIGAAGGILGNLIFGRFEKRIGRQFAITVGSLSLALYFMSYIFFNLIIQIVIFAFIIGFTGGMFSLAINAIFAETVPNEIRGRAYSATNSYVMVISVLSISFSGITADIIGIRETIFLAGLIILVFTVIMAKATNKFKFANKVIVEDKKMQIK